MLKKEGKKFFFKGVSASFLLQPSVNTPESVIHSPLNFTLMLDALPQKRFFLYDPCLLSGGPSFKVVRMGVHGKLSIVSNAYAYDILNVQQQLGADTIDCIALFLTCINIASLFLLDQIFYTIALMQ